MLVAHTRLIKVESPPGAKSLFKSRVTDYEFARRGDEANCKATMLHCPERVSFILDLVFIFLGVKQFHFKNNVLNITMWFWVDFGANSWCLQVFIWPWKVHYCQLSISGKNGKPNPQGCTQRICKLTFRSYSHAWWHWRVLPFTSPLFSVLQVSKQPCSVIW